MLKELYLKNLAVIDEQRLTFGKGFQVITGETGSGKSILLEAIGLVLGEKADSSIIRDGASEAMVEAVFGIMGRQDILDLLSESGVTVADDPDELIVRRQLSRDGKNKIFVNHQRASLLVLQKITKTLIDYTGQLEQTQLLNSSNDVCLLDAFLSDVTVKQRYQSQYVLTKSLAEAIVLSEQSGAQKAQRLEWLAFQLRDFNGLSVVNEEGERELRQLREYRKNSVLLSSFHVLVSDVLTGGEGNTLAQINKIRDAISKNHILDGLHGSLLTRLDEIGVLIGDVAYDLTKSAHVAPEDNLSLDDIESRLYVIENLKRRHGPTLTEVITKKTQIENEIASLQNLETDTQALKEKFAQAFAQLQALASDLRKQRVKAKKELENQISGELKSLHMPQVVFEVAIAPTNRPDDFGSYHTNGCDQITFMLSSNPGLGLRPLAKIASGGEASRIFLALKRVLSRFQTASAYLFDEIDAGVSGSAGELVGRKLKELSHAFQVICVTHNAQIASQADAHFVVQKMIEKQNTITRINRLDAVEDRVNELARLMGGVKITEKNLAFAREMVKGKESVNR
ncbi:MAG: hypothetical protein ACD_62C00127G0013 [uncultured bacterium]|nr:MAG: hypothetical protein ACD_62C00127G0013 [uncultured bacterium]